MKLYFSPYFDEEHYVDYANRSVMVGEKVVGPLGLLADLELRLGLSRELISSIERQVKYYDAVKRYTDAHPDSIISSSFKIDSFGVSERLLYWRDELAFAGWTKDVIEISDKLTLLASIEVMFLNDEVLGVSDRWQIIIEEINDATFDGFVDDFVIEVDFPKEFIHPVYVKILDLLQKNNVEVKYIVADKSIADETTNLFKVQQLLLGKEADKLNREDKSFSILNFKDYYNALEYFAANNSEAVYLNGDNKAYDNIQYTYGLPLSGSISTNANPQILQLFKLGLSLFIKPLNIYNLLSYLQVKVNPIPYDLRYKLINVIVKEGGVGNDSWNDAIDTYKWRDEKHKNQILKLLPIGENVSICKESIVQYNMALKDWAISRRAMILASKEQSYVDELVVGQLQELTQLCRALSTIMDSYEDGVISGQKLKSLVLSIYKPVSYVSSLPQKASSFVVSSAASMLDSADSVIYLDCQNARPKATQYSDITISELEVLNSLGILIWSENSQINAQLYIYKLAILNARKSVVLVCSEEARGERSSIHPLITQLSVQIINIDDFKTCNPPFPNELIVDEIFEPKEKLIGHKFPEKYKNLIRSRSKESYSSMSLLHNYPFDYVFNYLAKIRSSGLAAINGIDATMGTVAHLYIQKLIEQTKDIDELIKLHTEEYSICIESLMQSNGAILLLPENKSNKAIFVEKIKTSCLNFFTIIKSAGFKIVGCEIDSHYVEERIGCEVGAVVDVILKDKYGQTIVWDLKWTSNSKKFRKLLKDNMALQLEVYKYVLNKDVKYSNVAWVGYFLLKDGILYTTYTELKGIGNIGVVNTANNSDIYMQLLNSYNYRLKQLKDGDIEDAEGCCFADEMNDWSYIRDLESENLLKLTEYKGCKSSNLYSDYKIFKGGLK